MAPEQIKNQEPPYQKSSIERNFLIDFFIKEIIYKSLGGLRKYFPAVIRDFLK